jgi:hypothetical protein
MHHVEHAGMMRGMVMMVMTMLAAANRLGGANREEHSSGEGQSCR